ncbi:MAG: PAS domain S-box protein [Planctomycetales bacterium]|nr:PAS domain S-box protein [Planctomycetales bacterium]
MIFETDNDDFRNVFECAPDACYLSDLKGTFVDGNRAAEELVGYSRRELIGRNFLAVGLLRLRDVPKAAALLASNLAGNPTGPTEFVLAQKGGRRVSVEIRTQPITLRGKNLVFGIVREIGERVEAEKRLRESEARYRDLIENTTDLIQCVNPDGTFDYVNQAWQRTLGYTSDELANHLTVFDIVRPDCKPECQKVFQELLSGSRHAEISATFIAKDGREVFVEGNASCTFEGDTPVSTRAFFRDVTARKSAEAELSRLNAELEERVKQRTAELSEANQRLLAEIRERRRTKEELQENRAFLHDAQQVAHIGTFRLHVPSCEPEYWSEECYRIVGMDPSEQLPCQDDYVNRIVHPADTSQFKAILQNCACEGAAFEFEHRIVRPDGTVRWASSKGAPVIQDEQIVAIQGTFHDITDRKSAELTVRDSEERFRTVFESEPECVKLLDPEGRLLDMNAAGLAMIEADSLEQVRGQCIYPVVVPEHRSKFIAANEASFTGESGVLQFEIIGLHGTRRWMESHYVPLRNSEGGITASLSVTREITERMKAEASLRESEERFRAIFEQVAHSSALIDPTSTSIVEFNEQTHVCLGYSREEFEQLNFLDFEAQMSFEDIAEHMQKILSEGADSFETKHRTKNGDIRDVRVEASLIHIGGKPYVQTAWTDITDWKVAEEALRASEARWRSLTEHSPDHVLTLDSNLKIDFCNYASPGLTVDELIGTPLYSYVLDGQKNKIKGILEQVLRTGEAADYETEFEPRGGERIYYESRVSPRIVDGEINGLTVASRDVTRRKLAEEQNRALQAQLHHAQKMEAIGQLAAGVAHEFNNLLVAIRGNAELLLLSHHEKLSDGVMHSLKEIERGCARASTLTQQMLSFARKKDANLAVFDVNQLVTNSEPMFRRLIGHRINLTVQLCSPPLLVLADESDLEQALLNIILNARDAIVAEGSLDVQTDVYRLDKDDSTGQRKAGSYARIKVTDTGCGMSEETLRRAFEPFFTTKPAGQGTGLGLSTVYSDIARCNGFVSVNSTEGEGTIISVHLPMTDQPIQHAHDSNEIAESGGSETILVCDDEEIVLSAVSALLECVGYSVIGAKSGSEALEKVAEHSGDISLLLTDVTMPEMDGFELGAIINQQYPHVKVIYSSGYTADRTAAAHLRNVEFFEKGASTNVMLEKIRHVLDED